MADGARFDISIEAHSLGVDASTAQLNALADKIVDVDKVTTSFDAAVDAARKHLAETSDAANAAAAALARAQSKYNGLEVAADRAAKKLEEATVAGRSAAALEKLRAKATEATAAMKAQAAVVTELEGKSRAASAEQSKMAATLKTLEGQQKAATKEVASGGAVTQVASESFMTYLHSAIAVYKAVAQVGIAAFGAAKNFASFAISANPFALVRLNLAAQRLQFSFVKLFRGLDLSKFLGGVERLGALFDTTNTSGRALKLLIETIFQPMFDAVGKLEPYIGEFFKGMVYGALKVVIAVLKLELAIVQAMSPKTRAAIKAVIDRVFTLENAFSLGTITVEAFAVVVGGALVIALGAALIVAASLAAALSVVAAVVAGLVITLAIVAAVVLAPFLLIAAGIALITGKWDAFKKWITDLATSAAKWGGDIVDGMINGITGRTKPLGDAMKGGVDAVKNAVAGSKGLDIHSPSRWMEDRALDATAGWVRGSERGVDELGDTGAAMADAVMGGVMGDGVSSSSSSSSRSVHIAQLTINAPNGDGASIAAEVKRAIVEVFEGAALSIGGGEVPA